MVMHVQVQAEHSFVSVDDSVNVVLLEPDDRDNLSSNNNSWLARDTSNTCRDTSIDNTRVAISYHTHTSILDLTKDEDEEDSGDEDDDASVLFRDLLESDPKRLQEDAAVMDANVPNKKDPTDENIDSHSVSFERFSPEHFFDSLCLSHEQSSDNHNGSKSEPGAAVPLSSTRSRTCPATWSPNCMSVPCAPSRVEEEDEDEDGEEHQICSLPQPGACPPTPSTARLQIETDVWNLLGCTSPPDMLELDSIWYLTTTTAPQCDGPRAQTVDDGPEMSRPPRASLKDRMARIHRLRLQDNQWSGATRHGVTVSQHGAFSPSTSLKSMSMDVLDAKDYSSWKDSSMNDLSFASMMGLSSQPDTSMRARNHQRRRESPTPNLNESSLSRPDAHLQMLKVDGYDSDPELGMGARDIDEDETYGPEDEWEAVDVSTSSDPPFPNRMGVSSTIAEDGELQRSDNDDEQDFMIYQTVQQTLNSTWTLTWHPNDANIQEFQIASRVMKVNIWMERGTVITHSGVVVEPMFMWRDAYQSHDLLQQRKRLNDTCQKPWSMRLLNTCRIAPCASSLDKSLYPLARSACCLIVKTCQNQEFVLEAQSSGQRDMICERWKLAVARFASLAVTEDIDAIAQEFFHPTLSAQTLTVQQQQQQQKRNQEKTAASMSQDVDAGMISTSYSGSSASTSDGDSWDGTTNAQAKEASGETLSRGAPTPQGARWVDI